MSKGIAEQKNGEPSNGRSEHQSAERIGHGGEHTVRTQTIDLDYMTKLYGHASLHVKVRGSKVENVEMRIIEGARFFEAIVKDRKAQEAPTLTSRICGTCSPSHNLTSILAVENAYGLVPSEETRKLRELLLLGSVLQNHALHLFFLALPDYLGFENAISMASERKEEVKLGLSLKHLGNHIVKVVGGREVHPLTTEIGGFSKVPKKEEFNKLLKQLHASENSAISAVKLFSGLNYPSFKRRTQYVALRSSEKLYSYLGEKIISDSGTEILPNEYDKHLKECAVPRSSAKEVTIGCKPFAVGTLSRMNLNRNFLCGSAKGALDSCGISFPNYSPFSYNVARAIEMLHCICSSEEIIRSFDLERAEVIKPNASLDAPKEETRGIAVTEAPRGLLFHDYKIGKDGKIMSANIITPTAQNIRNIEEDVKAFLPHLLPLGKEKIISGLEELVRAYDPCLSCSSHFLKIKMDIR